MTTLAELIAMEPTYTWGYPVNELTYGGGTWRFAFMIADQGAGASVEWHDLTGPVSEMTWSRGSSSARGRFQAVEPSVLVNAFDDKYAPWNPDTSASFGVHVPLRAGRLLMRASVFRVVGTSVDLHLPLFTARVRRWGDAQAGNGGYRYHRIDGLDLMSYLVQAPIAGQQAEGWYSRIADLLVDSDWPFGSEVYGARTVDATTTLTLSTIERQDSAIVQFDATLDPAGLTWRTNHAGKLIVHPFPWDTFHSGIFAGAGTVVGDEWTPPIGTYYAGGPTFAYDAAGDEVQFITEIQGGSFGINSDIENVANEWTITHPVLATDLEQGYTTSAYDDPVSASRYGRRAIPAASWLAENDIVQNDMVDAFAYTDLTAAPLTIDVRNPGAFPALAVLDHYDPCTIRHATAVGRNEVTVTGPLRQIAHSIRKWGPNLLWRATVQIDVDSTEATSEPLLPVEDLTAYDITDWDAYFSWTNPSQTITPTGTQVRMVTISTQWLDLPYPGTGAASFAWLFLNPSTLYTFDVRLIREVDGNITHVSPTRSVSFQTAASVVPVPGPGGPGGGIITIPVDNYDPECTIEWKLDSTDDGSTWTLVDSGDETDFTVNPETGETELDLSAVVFVDGLMYRVCTREVCAAVPGAWVCSVPFNPDCASPAQLLTAPFSDAVVFVPQVCGTVIEEAISGEPVSLGISFGGVVYDEEGNYALSSGGSASSIFWGDSENLPLADDDRAIHAKVKISTVVAVDALWRVGRLRIAILNTGGGVFKFAAIKSFSGGSITAIGTTTVANATEYEVEATWDRSLATVAIKVNGVEEATQEDAANYVNTPNLPTFTANLPVSSYGTEYAAWERSTVYGGVTLSDIGLDALYHASGPEMASLAYANGATVTAWPDELNLSNDLGNIGSPVLVASDSVWNNLPSISFPAVTSYFPETPSGGSTYSLVFLAHATGSGTIRWLDNNQPGSGARVIVEESSGTWRVFRGSTVASSLSATAGLHLVVLYCSGTSTSLEVDGVAATLITTAGSNSAGIRFATGSNSGAKTSPLLGWRNGGDIRTHGNWATWKAEIAALYGMTIA